MKPYTPRTSTPGRLVFILDDDPDEGVVIRSILAPAGFECLTFTDPVKCIEVLKHSRCDLLTTCLVMPEMDGYQVLTEANRLHPDMPVIVISGHLDPSGAVVLIKRGATDVFDKPVDGTVLVAAANRAVEESCRTRPLAPVRLTKMEMAVLRRILTGTGNAQIARALGVSIRTIEDLRRNTMRKMCVDSVVDLVKRVIKLGLDPEDINRSLNPRPQVIAWGCNSSGQCNVPAHSADIVAIAAGGSHSLCLKANGSIMAWGSDVFGQCRVPAPNSGFTAIAAGYGHSLGLKADGSVVAWGYSRFGQCRMPNPNKGFVAIAAGFWHSLGLRADGSVEAWGYDRTGQCTIAGPNLGFIAIAGDMLHSLALRADGSILGLPASYGMPEPNKDFTAISAGGLHNLALRADGSTVVWGTDNHDQCKVPGTNTGFRSIARGGSHSLGLKTDGTIVAWGDNQYNQCRVPATTDSIVAIAAGERHCLLLREIPSVSSDHVHFHPVGALRTSRKATDR
jgi:FixJ family two-component response regulator/alpha-tubulin suppressor-like RCC1 family protein